MNKNKGSSKDRFKRVNWASDEYLCQVKLFLSEDCPSQIGSNAEDHLQVKASLHSNGLNIDDLPPGFGGMGPSHTPDQICVSQIKWNRPPIFKLNNDWHVVAGEQSDERGTQNYREMRVLEALYPRISAIPPSPSVSPELETCGFDDSQTPIIPLNSIEDEDIMPAELTPCSNLSNGVEFNVPIEIKSSVNEKLLGTVTGLDADVISAASAAFTASLKGNEKGSMVDTDLLIKILNEPKMIEALTKVSGSSVTPIFEPFTNNICRPKISPASDSSFNSKPYQARTTSRPSVASSERANENSKPFPTFPIPYSVPELPNQSNSTTLLGHVWQSQENGHLKSPENWYLKREDRLVPGKTPSNDSELLRMAVPGLNPSIFGSLDILKAFSPSLRPNAVPTARPENHIPTNGPHMSLGSSSQFPAPQLDRFTLPSIRAPAPKDLNYYKSLIRLHGSGAEETKTAAEQFMPQYPVSLPEVTPVSVQGHPRPMSQRICKFFNSPKGCRSGSACTFDHVPLLDTRPGNYPDTDRSKRLKISSDLQDKC